MTEKIRCFGTGDPIYQKYHDEEWGKPIEDSPDEKELYERLALEGFMAGLSWITVLRKREAFRKTFKGFDPAKVAKFTEKDVERLATNADIIRNKAKIRAAITNARALQQLHADGEHLMEWFVEHTPPPREARVQFFGDLHSSTPETAALSKRMKKAGFSFVGPVTIYATMQAIGLIDDHLADCWVVTANDRTAQTPRAG